MANIHTSEASATSVKTARSFVLKPGARRATLLSRRHPGIFASRGESVGWTCTPQTVSGRKRCYGFIALIGSICLWCLHAEALSDVSLPQPKPTLLMYLLCVNELIWVPTYPMMSCFDFTDELPDPPPPNMGFCTWYSRRVRAFWYRAREYFTWQFFMVFCVTGFFAESLWVWSLHGTTPPVNNTIYQLGIVFTAILSAMFLPNERLGLCKVWWILFSIGGVAMVSFQVMDDEEEKEGIGVTTWWGIALCAITALIGAIEGVYSKHLDYAQNYASIGTEEEFDEERNERSPWEAFKDSMVFSTAYSVMMGLACWAFVLVFHFTGVEEFEMPGMEEWIFVLIYSASSDVYECLECWGLFVAGPMMMSTGSVLVIPVSYSVGIFRETVKLNDNGSAWMLIVGTLACITGVVFIEWDPCGWQKKSKDYTQQFSSLSNASPHTTTRPGNRLRRDTKAVFRVADSAGIAYRSSRMLRDKTTDVVGPKMGALVYACEVRNDWIQCKLTGYWLPIRIEDDLLLEKVDEKSSSKRADASTPLAGANSAAKTSSDPSGAAGVYSPAGSRMATGTPWGEQSTNQSQESSTQARDEQL